MIHTFWAKVQSSALLNWSKSPYWQFMMELTKNIGLKPLDHFFVIQSIENAGKSGSIAIPDGTSYNGLLNGNITFIHAKNWCP